MNIDKVKIKHIIGSYVRESNYPTPEDIIYLMVMRADNKGRDLKDVTFTTTYLYKKVGDEFKVNIEKSLNEMLESGAIEKTRDNSEGSSYKIKTNPYYEF